LFFTIRRKTAGRLLTAAVLGVWLAGTGAAAEEAPALLEPVGVKMDTAAAYIGEIAQITVYEGAVAPRVQELYFTVNGQVGDVNVVVGQQVRAGDVLMTLDGEAEEERMEALRRQADYLETMDGYEKRLDQLSLEKLAVELSQLRGDGDTEAAARKELDLEAEKMAQAFEQELRSMELARVQDELRALEAQVQGYTLRAPFDGCVLYGAALETGSAVSAYSPVLYLADDAELTVESEYISSTFLDNAHDLYALIGAEKYSLTPVELDREEYISRVLAGETIRSQFQIDQADEALHAGLYAAVCLVGQYASDALLVPGNALYRDAAGQYVYVVEEGERVRRPVRTGIATDGLVQIVEGLEEGALVYVKE
jgi:RND family efflux transporter MFP subunit